MPSMRVLGVLVRSASTSAGADHPAVSAESILVPTMGKTVRPRGTPRTNRRATWCNQLRTAPPLGPR